MIKTKLEEMQRQRIKKMSNILPQIIADKKSPSFFYYAKEHFIDFDEITKKPFVYQPLPREDPITKYRRVVNQKARKSRALSMMGQQLKLSVDEVGTTLTSEHEQGNPIRFQPYSLQRAALFDKGCITCGGPNLSVTYHGERHICLKCRDSITTLNGDPVLIFQDDDGQVVVVGMADEESGKKMYFVQLDELKIQGYRCYVTFSGENELICLLHDKYNDDGKIGNQIQKSALYQSQQPRSHRQLQKKNFIQQNKKNVAKN